MNVFSSWLGDACGKVIWLTVTFPGELEEVRIPASGLGGIKIKTTHVDT